MAIDYKALGAKAAAQGTNMTVAQTGGGGDYEPPAKGPTRLRFVAYAELGKQKGTFQGKPTLKEKVQLVFELSGKNHPPTVKEDGTKVPLRITITENFSLNEKANFFKLFQRLNYKQEAQHIAELLGNAYKGEVFHHTFKDKMGKDRVIAELKSKEAGYSIAPPRVEDDEVEGGWRVLEVAPALSVIKCFLWDFADIDQWNGLFIEGEYPERKDDKGAVIAPAKSKNVLQNTIKSAVNFVGSPMYDILSAGGQKIDIPTTEDQDEDEAGNEQAGSGSAPAQPSSLKTAPSDDALGGIV